MKKIFPFLLILIFIGCKEKTVAELTTLPIDYYEPTWSINEYIEHTKGEKLKYDSLRDSEKQLIIYNFPFDCKDSYDMYVYCQGDLIYQRSVGKMRNIDFRTNKFLSIRVDIVHNSNVYGFGTKGSFSFQPDDKYFYLVFCPTNDKDYMFNIIPSNSEVD